jgi:hypothetical protein
MSSPIQIRRPETVESIRALAQLTGQSVTDAIETAVKTQLAIETVKADAELARKREDAERILAEIRRLPIVGPTLTDRDLYDENGLPK